MDLNKRYIIDLSNGKSPADIVFELSNIIEKEEAANQRIWLKLGDITLNQSQILSINSLINSINSTLSLIESQSAQTELAAATLGISTKDVEEEIQEELEQNTPEAPLNTEKEEPTEQYIPMTDHIEDEPETIEEQIEEESSIKDSEHLEEVSDESEIEIEEETTATENDVETVEEPEQKKESEPVFLTDVIKEENVADEEIQEHLDSIFDSETKLENILSEDKDINEMKNWPLTKEVGEVEEFEIPEEVMTDEDYEILQMNTQYHKQTVRSGQVIKSNGNVVIIGDCHPGCEIHAAGDITVWGVLGGIAHAGSKGNSKARIRALNLNAIQLRIADSFARRPDHIKNVYVEKTNTFTPEEARNINGSIVILKTNDK